MQASSGLLLVVSGAQTIVPCEDRLSLADRWDAAMIRFGWLGLACDCTMNWPGQVVRAAAAVTPAFFALYPENGRE